MNKHSKRPRRWHSAEFKKQVVAACKEPGASVAGVALAHGINANLARRWLREWETPAVSDTAGANALDFVPVRIELPEAAPRDIRLELRRGGSLVTIHWPLSAASELGAWLQAWLR